MTVVITDKFIKGARKLAGTIDSSGIINGTVDNFGLSSASGLPTDTPVEITVDRVDSNGNLTPDKEEVIKGIVNGNRIVDAVRGTEGTAQSHQPGAVWEVRLTAHQWEEMVDGIQEEHNPDGSHKRDGWSSFPKNSGVDLVFSATDANTISVAGYDLTGVIQKGDKIKLTNNGTVKYYYISTVPAFSTNTTFDVSGEVDLVAGAITLPYFSKIDSPQGFKKGEVWYKARAHRSGTQGINDNTETQIQLNAKSYDLNNNFDNSSNFRYTAPISGYYEIKAGAVCYSYDNITSTRLHINVNGTNISSVESGTTSGKQYTNIPTAISDLAYVTKGQYIMLKIYVDTISGAQAEIGSAYCSINFISV